MAQAELGCTGDGGRGHRRGIGDRAGLLSRSRLGRTAGGSVGPRCRGCGRDGSGLCRPGCPRRWVRASTSPMRLRSMPQLRSTVEALGSIGGLVHAAGTVQPALEDVVDLDTWDSRARGEPARRGGPGRARSSRAMRAAGPGSAIVGISSIEGMIGHGFIPSYVASKHGLIGLTRSLAHRLGPDGIRANAVCPGYIDTPMLAPTIATARGPRCRSSARSRPGGSASPTRSRGWCASCCPRKRRT